MRRAYPATSAHKIAASRRLTCASATNVSSTKRIQDLAKPIALLPEPSLRAEARRDRRPPHEHRRRHRVRIATEPKPCSNCGPDSDRDRPGRESNFVFNIGRIPLRAGEARGIQGSAGKWVSNVLLISTTFSLVKPPPAASSEIALR